MDINSGFLDIITPAWEMAGDEAFLSILPAIVVITMPIIAIVVGIVLAIMKKKIKYFLIISLPAILLFFILSIIFGNWIIDKLLDDIILDRHMYDVHL